MENMGQYGLIVAIGSAITIPVMFFGIIGDDGKILSALLNSRNERIARVNK
jgi:hypothetical protein